MRTRPIIAVRIIVVWAAVAILLDSGCAKPAPKPGSSGHSGDRTGQSAHRDELYEIAIGTLDRLEEFDGQEMLQQSINRLDSWVTQQPPAEDWTPDPFVVQLREGLASYAGEVREIASQLVKLAELDDLDEIDAQFEKVSQLFEELSLHSREMAETSHLPQFLQLAREMSTHAGSFKPNVSSTDGDTPKRTPEQVKAFVEQLDASGLEFLALRLDEFARQIEIEDLAFPASSSEALRETVWFRNVSRWVAGTDRGDPLQSAIRLFDWTVRNIQLDSDPSSPDGEIPNMVLQNPWETLLFGHGTARDRAWVFMLLARQQRLDAALLGTIDPQDPDRPRLKSLGVGVLIDGEIYVFDPNLGVPLPGPDGVRIDEGELLIDPATLTQLAADDSWLKQMDLGAEHSYDLGSSDFQKVVVLLETSPVYLTKRMKLVESRLSGENRLVLTAAPEEQAESFKSCPQVIEVRRWERPYQTILQAIELGQTRAQWLTSQLLPFYLGSAMTPSLWKGRVYHFKGVFSGDPNAIVYYQSARRSQRELDAERNRLNQLIRSTQSGAEGAAMAAQTVRVLETAKMNAGYWLGLIHAHQGNNDSAIDYFQKRTILAFAGGPWTPGAGYNLARAFEAENRFPEAIKAYRIDGGSPSYEGNLLRAMWLEKLTKAEGVTVAEKGVEEKEEKAGKEGEE